MASSDPGIDSLDILMHAAGLTMEPELIFAETVPHSVTGWDENPKQVTQYALLPIQNHERASDWYRQSGIPPAIKFAIKNASRGNRLRVGDKRNVECE